MKRIDYLLSGLVTGFLFGQILLVISRHKTMTASTGFCLGMLTMGICLTMFYLIYKSTVKDRNNKKEKESEK